MLTTESGVCRPLNPEHAVHFLVQAGISGRFPPDYALKNSKDVGDLKAVSMNLMHSNMSITDGVHGIFTNNDVRSRINMLGSKLGENRTISKQEIIDQLIKITNMLIQEKKQ